MLIENSRFDNNEDGFDTNSQNGDNPPPQNGACPAGVQPRSRARPRAGCSSTTCSTTTTTRTCPPRGSAAAGPVGTGMSLSGGRNDTVMDNMFANNGAWGQIVVPYPDSGPAVHGWDHGLRSERAAACSTRAATR